MHNHFMVENCGAMSYTDIAQDKDGYLLDIHDWNLAIAEQIAHKEHIVLDAKTWQAIMAMHRFYQTYQLEPTMRAFITFLKQHAEQHPDSSDATLADSILLHHMFPGGVLKQLCKIAGLPKPKRCFSA